MRAALLAAVLVTGTIAACSTTTSTTSSCSTSGAASTVNASDALAFSPAADTVTHGQSVCWQNTGSVSHTVTSNDGTSFNASLAGGQIFVRTFATAGSFPYHCTIHAGMTGTIVVQ